MEDFNYTKKAVKRILKEETEPLQLVPSVAIKLLKLTNDENSRIDDLTRIIETEPTLATKILRNVNSAAYSLPKNITSINRAVNILGFSTVRRIALAQLFFNKLIRHDLRKNFNSLFFWQHCLFVATLSRRIAIDLKHPDPDMIYTAGLIHDIGKIILENHGRSSYSDFIASKKNSASMLDDERRFFGLTHVDVGHYFCLEWQIPSSIIAAVTFHHNPPDLASPYAKFRQEIAIVAFADHIAWMQGLGSFYDIDCHPVLDSDVLASIDIDQLNLDDLLQYADRELQNTLEFYGIAFPSVNQLRATLLKTAVKQSQKKIPASNKQDLRKNQPLFLSSLTAPHQNLNPEDFLPLTLKAIHTDFSFDRVMMLTINPKRRCLVASHCWPPAAAIAELPPLDLEISSVSGLLLECLREKKPALINNEIENDNPLLKKLNVKEFLTVPVLDQQRLLGILYADNGISNKPLAPDLLTELNPIAKELGIALMNAKQYEMEKKQAQLDPLTQLYNKRMINHFLTEIFQQDPMKLAKIAIGFIDIDRFKQVNDICGHQAGDDALKIVAEILRNLTRPEDFIGRYGGEEFVFLLRNTSTDGALGYAERIRKEIERQGTLLRKKFHNRELTASIGVATYTRRYKNYTDMIKVADQAMYRAKNEGRNRVVLITSPPSE